MTARRLLIAAAFAGGLAWLAGGVAVAEPLPRTAHVARALAAVRGLGAAAADELDRALYNAARSQCPGTMLAGRPAAENDHVIVTVRAHRYPSVGCCDMRPRAPGQMTTCLTSAM